MDVEIRSKQKELADLQESKTQQLIASIANLELRNKDLQKKHQILVEDYSYNLELLEAKDAEMGRLDALVKASQDDRDAAEHRVKSLLLKIEALESKELERACKAKEDRARNQALAVDLKEEIESMRWKAMDELARKQREIDALHHDNKLLAVLREESLVAQRHDLTASFEHMAAQRERIWLDKELALGKRLEGLEAVFQQLRTENFRLKSESQEARREADQRAAELAVREEARRQTQWLLEDERLQRAHAEDELKRKLDASHSSLTAVEELVRSMKGDRASLEAKSEAELERLRAYASSLEQRSQEHAKRVDEVVGEMDASALRHSAKEAALLAELEQTKRSCAEESSWLSHEWQGRLARSEARAAALLEDVSVEQAALEQTRTDAAALRASLREAEQAVARLEEEQHRRVALAEGALLKESQRLALSEEQCRHSDALLSGVQAELASSLERMESLQRENSQLQTEARSVALEKEVLQLRLNALTANTADARPRTSRDVYGQSPSAFSEDFSSLPSSPTRLNYSKGSQLFIETAEPEPHFTEESIRRVLEENDSLKAVVRSMREDIEHLRVQQSPARESADANRIATLERRLQLTVNEVARLRLERQKLMDIGNSLRAQLSSHKTTGKVDASIGDDLARDLPLDRSHERQTHACGIAREPVDEGKSDQPDLRAELQMIKDKNEMYLFGVPIQNSARATVSQLQALERLKKKDRKHVSRLSVPSRRVINYAKAGTDDE